MYVGSIPITRLFLCHPLFIRENGGEPMKIWVFRCSFLFFFIGSVHKILTKSIKKNPRKAHEKPTTFSKNCLAELINGDPFCLFLLCFHRMGVYGFHDGIRFPASERLDGLRIGQCQHF